MKRKHYSIVIGALVLVILLVAVAVTPAVGQEGTFSLADLAEQIRTGEIDVGDEFGMGPEQRYHLIHAGTLDMSCSQCHVEDAPYELAQPLSEDVDSVDRRVCLGCHLNGPATKLYEPKE
jgi:hypothetical protein